MGFESVLNLFRNSRYVWNGGPSLSWLTGSRYFGTNVLLVRFYKGPIWISTVSQRVLNMLLFLWNVVLVANDGVGSIMESPDNS